MTIVTGYVPTPEGTAAVAYGIEEARRRGTRLIVVNTSSGDALVDRRYASASDWSAVEEQLATSGVEFEVVRGVTGTDAADTLLATADETNAELIVIGLRKRSPVGKLIMGSQAQTILLDAACPVVAVKAGS